VTLLNRELVSRVKLCLVSVFPDIVKDCPKIRNLPKFFLRSFENVGHGSQTRSCSLNADNLCWKIIHTCCKELFVSAM